MNEDKIINILKDIGVDGAMSDENREFFEDYFAERASDDSGSEDESKPEPDEEPRSEGINLSDISIPFSQIEGNQILDFDLSSVTIELEQNEIDVQIVDEGDSGGHVLQNLDNSNDNLEIVDGTYSDESDDKLVSEFFELGCGCKENCIRNFSYDECFSMRLECADLDHYDKNVNKLDQVILGQLRCLTSGSKMTSISKRKEQNERKQPRTKYYIKGQLVCKNTYMFMHQIKIKRMKRLTKMYNATGLVASVHGNAGKLAKNATTFSDAQYVVKFLQNYAEQHAIFLPGRSSTVFNTKLKLLPCSDNKNKIYEFYKNSFTPEMQNKPVSCKLFSNLWRQTCSDIIVMKPKSDLCSLCQKHFTSGASLALATEEEKIANIDKIRSHLSVVSKERQYYRDTIENSKNSFQDESLTTKPFVHYSFDMAQQVHIPSNPLQPGPVYFLTPFKIGIFGVMCETVNKQVNYLIPESVSTTKGSNLIVSLFHYHLQYYGHGEETMYIHADNCVGQNKNNILMGYLAWRICNNLNKKIVLTFMPVGHTKFSCDWAFGLLKRKFRNTFVSSVQEFADCIQQSTPVSLVNQAVPIGNEKGDVFVPVHDWLNFFKDNMSRKIPGIKQYSHFHFDEKFKGKVNCKISIEDAEFAHTLFPFESGPEGFPIMLVPEGLSDDRKMYLFKNIRQFCKEECKDIVCPVVEEPEPPGKNGVDPSKKSKKRKRSK